jgi:uncharacterized protein (DUF302 family)
MSADPTTEVAEHKTSLTFDMALDRTSAAITRAGLTIFAKIDHAAGARDVGLTMPATTVLLYGHAKGGTPIMLAAPSVALDLPLRVLIREDADGHAIVAFHPARQMLEAAGLPEALASRLDPAQKIIIEALSS